MIKNKDIELAFNPIIFSTLAILKLSFKKEFLKERGSIVVMSSVSSQSGKSGMALYASARGALESLVKNAAHELASQGKRINAVRAGAVETEMHERLTSNLSGSQLQDYESNHLLGFGKPEDITHVVRFLLDEKSSWITGSTINVDGGFLA